MMVWDMAVLGGILIGIALDLVIGWPAWIYARIGHPVGWLARWISFCERRGNHGGPVRRLITGAGTTFSAITLACAVWGGIAVLVETAPWRALAYGVLFWPLIAMRSMHAHVADVARPLIAEDLAAARHAVSMIVGRDPAQLDQAGVARAALESLGENSSDGVIAPLFWGVLFGPAGMAAYKAINTLDSMIGHRNARYEWFGKVAARVDDLANLVPARLTGFFFAVAAPWGRKGLALRVMWRDARFHRSPNAGWPESALAAAIGCRLSGPRSYGGATRAEPWLFGEGPDPAGTDVLRGLAVYRRAMGLACAVLILMWGICL